MPIRGQASGNLQAKDTPLNLQGQQREIGRPCQLYVKKILGYPTLRR